MVIEAAKQDTDIESLRYVLLLTLSPNCLLVRTVSQVSDVAHGPLVLHMHACRVFVIDGVL